MPFCAAGVPLIVGRRRAAVGVPQALDAVAVLGAAQLPVVAVEVRLAEVVALVVAAADAPRAAVGVDVALAALAVVLVAGRVGGAAQQPSGGAPRVDWS